MLRSHLLAIVDGFVRPEVRAGRGDELTRARLLVLTCFSLSALAAVFFVLVVVTNGMVPSAWCFVVVWPVVTAIPFVMRRFGQHTRLARIALATTIAFLGALSLINGFHDAAAHVWYPAIPLLAGLLVGPRAGFASAAALAGLTWGFYELSHNGLRPLEPYTIDDVLLFRTWGMVSCLVFIAAIGWVHARLRRDTLRRVDAAVARLESANSALAEMRDRAEAASEAKSDFLATMSHEIRTPMNGVMGFVELLRTTGLGPTQQRYVETIHGSAETLLALIDDILDFSKIEADRLELEVAPFRLDRVVEDVVDLFAQKAQRAGIEIMSAIDAQAPMCLIGDRGRLRQVLTNLIGNAVKFTPEGEVLVRADLGPNGGEGPLVEIQFEVRDTGIGMGHEDQERVFSAFTQADASTSRRYGGSGLGLAICKRLVELMGGEIGVRSAPGGGSVFWFTALFERPSASADIVETTTDYGALPAGIRVLVATPGATHASVLRSALSRFGLRVRSGASADEVVQALATAKKAQAPFDVVIVDSAMDLSGGQALIRSVRKAAQRSNLPVVRLVPQDARCANSALAHCEIVTRPVRRATLRDALRRALAYDAAPTGSHRIVDAVGTPRPGRRLTPCRVLLVEDNVVNQAVAGEMLALLVEAQAIAPHGRAAVEILAAERFDLVFMDCQMPEMDGYAATAAIRRLEGETRHTPIVGLTAHALVGDRERCLAAGMDDYLSKPVRLEELAAVIDRWVPIARDATGAAPPPLVG